MSNISTATDPKVPGSKRKHGECDPDESDDSELKGAILGPGPPWASKRGPNMLELLGEDGMFKDFLLHQYVRMERMLKNALEGGDDADVVFELDDRSKNVSGHKALLSSTNDVWNAMFGPKTKETRTGIVRLRGCKKASARALVEFIYLGHPGKECEKADLRELYNLAEHFQMFALCALLVKMIDHDSVTAAYCFALIPQGDRDPICEACHALCRMTLQKVPRGTLRGVDKDTIKMMLKDRCRNGRKLSNASRREALECFNLVNLWESANENLEGCMQEDVRDLARGLPLGVLSKDEMRIHLKSGRFTTDEELVILLSDHCHPQSIYQGDYTVIESCGDDHTRYMKIAVYGAGMTQRIAAVKCSDPDTAEIHIFGKTGGPRVILHDAGAKPFAFSLSACMTFKPDGSLFVCDSKPSGRGKFYVFDRTGKLTEEIPHESDDQDITDVKFTPSGKLLVCDYVRNRIEIRDENTGMLLSFFGNYGDECSLDSPTAIAVAKNGNIACIDSSGRLQLFTENGAFVTEVGDFTDCKGIATGADGDFLVCFSGRGEFQIFSCDGVYTDTVEYTLEDCMCTKALAVDDDGHIFFTQWFRPSIKAAERDAHQLTTPHNLQVLF